MLVLCYPKCSTCKKALKWLDEHGVAYDNRHIAQENPSAEELKEWHKKSGLPLKKFFNTSGMIYRENNIKDKLPNMTEEEQYELLASNGMLVKRPMVIGDDFVLVGFKEKDYEEKLLG
ncbi:MAG: arsenate reductase family protein [Eubacteriales bacterium]|nr:arsenate reductase family protein [Eubacteriales bacterium]